jgi:RNA polymerase sigma-70 factor (ECF subfamily)
LLSRLKDWGDEASWRDFFETYWRLIYLSATKSGLTDAEAQEVVQETVIEVCRRMPKFEYRPETGSFKSWLLKLTNWRIVDQLRQRQRSGKTVPIHLESVQEAIEGVLPSASRELESLWDNEWQSNLMAAALYRVKQRVNARQYQVFDLCVIQQWPVGKVARTLKVTRGFVYLAKHRVASEIKKEIQHLERHPLVANPDEA